MELDWRIASIAFMVLVGAYNILFRKFFLDGEDWRVIIPFLFIAVAVLGAYFLISYREVRFGANSLAYGIAIILMSGLVVVLSTYIFAHPGTELNVAVPIMSLGTVVTVALGILFLGEVLSLRVAFGILLALISIVLLAWR